MIFDNIQDLNLVLDISVIVIMMALAFGISVLLTPVMTHFLYKYKLGKNIRTSGAPVFTEMHQKKQGTPTMGGILIWLTTALLTGLFWLLATLFPDVEMLQRMNFLSRAETYLPIAAMLFAAALGIVDDVMNIFKIGPKGGGLRMKHRLFLYLIVAVVAALWFYFKLDWDVLHVPGVGDFSIGWWAIPLFIFVIVAASFSANEADGLDGLAGGILLACFGAYGVISYAQGKVALAIFCAAIIGGLLSFLWFNIFPARFFMGDTGSMSLGVTLGILAMLTNTILVLPIIAFPLVIESASVLIQIPYKKMTGKKIFHSTPIHHHFEAIGWPETKVTMRFWIIATISAALGLVVGLVGMG
ncbi:MAG: phospho-N-acetylmuramoyl-pentapeptide-transferase [Candidatus Doudnabacteria bacterium]|nr:phospho-N-acetylmuramoyl-pentapeptide-transferase [Candidatus Doudnabacteria bacterium]